MMKARSHGVARIAFGTAAVITLIGGGLLLTAAGSPAPGTSRVVSQIGNGLVLGAADMPQPPKPPAPPAPVEFVQNPPAPPVPGAPPAAPRAPSAPAAATPSASSAKTWTANVSVKNIPGAETWLGGDATGSEIEREIETALAEAGVEGRRPIRFIMTRRGSNTVITSDDATPTALADCLNKARAEPGKRVTIATCTDAGEMIDTVNITDTLKLARAEIAASDHLTPEQRRHALAGIDAAIARGGE